MPDLSLNLSGMVDDLSRNNFKVLQDELNTHPLTNASLQVCEVFATANESGGKLAHKLGGVPLDVLMTRLIAPSAARLTFRYSEFSSTEVVYDVTGLAANESLSARFLIGTFTDVVTVGTVVRGDSETQQYRGTF